MKVSKSRNSAPLSDTFKLTTSSFLDMLSSLNFLPRTFALFNVFALKLTLHLFISCFIFLPCCSGEDPGSSNFPPPVQAFISFGHPYISLLHNSASFPPSYHSYVPLLLPHSATSISVFFFSHFWFTPSMFCSFLKLSFSYQVPLSFHLFSILALCATDLSLQVCT